MTSHTELQTAMDFDHVVQVHADGTISDPKGAPYAPTVEHVGDSLDVSQLGDWVLMTGFTGQYSYDGPVMHSSEYIGGGMADAILSHPGLYVCVTVEAPCDYDSDETDCEESTGCDCAPAGWAVAFMPTAETL